ncbi:hypothetical protein [Paenibacillus sp. MBLB4367]|uniref:hypothetical protein n=1 Tax=Paenibacillus sp. MBLB4367 TaxID=3384767 RepID=UPI00390803C4
MEERKNALHSENEQVGNAYRERQIAEWEALIAYLRNESEERRHSFFHPDTSSVEAYEQGLEPYRDKFREMLGWPLAMPGGPAQEQRTNDASHGPGALPPEAKGLQSV